MQFLDDNVDFAQYLKDRDGQKIRAASTWTDAVLNRIKGLNGTTGDVLPWSKTHGQVQLRPGEVSVWAGISDMVLFLCEWPVLISMPDDRLFFLCGFES